MAVAQSIRVRGDLFAVDLDRARKIGIKSADDVEKRGLTASASAENGNHTALGELHCDVVENVDLVLLTAIEIFFK